MHEAWSYMYFLCYMNIPRMAFMVAFLVSFDLNAWGTIIFLGLYNTVTHIYTNTHIPGDWFIMTTTGPEAHTLTSLIPTFDASNTQVHPVRGVRQQLRVEEGRELDGRRGRGDQRIRPHWSRKPRRQLRPQLGRVLSLCVHQLRRGRSGCKCVILNLYAYVMHIE